MLIMALGFVYLTNSNSGAVAVNQVQAPVVEIAKPDNPSSLAKVEDKVSADKYITDKVLGESTSVEGGSKGERKPMIVQAKTVQKPARRQLTARGNRPEVLLGLNV
jgi:hypothetical protein